MQPPTGDGPNGADAADEYADWGPEIFQPRKLSSQTQPIETLDQDASPLARAREPSTGIFRQLIEK
jgi:hypothetical protein